MAMLSQVNVRFQNYVNSFIDNFRELYTQNELTDIIIVADGQKIRAHRVCLAVCSKYFRNLFTTMNVNQLETMVCLKSVPFDDLKKVIDFIYGGSINMLEKDLPGFLTTANYLEINGFENINELRASDEPNETHFKIRKCFVKLQKIPDSVISKLTSKNKDETTTKFFDQTKSKDDQEPIKQMKSTLLWQNKIPPTLLFNCSSDNDFGFKGFIKSEALLPKEHKSFACDYCDNTFARNYYLSKHKQSVHAAQVFQMNKSMLGEKKGNFRRLH